MKSNFTIHNFPNLTTSGIMNFSAYINDPNNPEMGSSLHTLHQKFN